MNALTRPDKAETRRGAIAIGGTDIAQVVAGALDGSRTYEINFLRVMTGRDPSAGVAASLPAMFVALAAGQASDADLDMTRLAASTGAEFEHAILPALGSADRLRGAASALASGGTVESDVSSGGPRLRLAELLHERLVASCPSNPHLARLSPRSGVDALAAALLLEAGVAPELAPFIAVASRLPVLAAVFLAERNERPNRFVGLEPGRPAPLAESLAFAEEVTKLLEANASYAETMVRLVLGRKVDKAERRIIDAALVSGAEYAQTAASAGITRLMASSGASAIEAYRGLISTFGYYHLGALKESARIIERASQAADIEQVIAASIVYDSEQPGRPARGRVAGFGHRFQHRDQRAALLLEMCRKRFPGRFVETAATLDERLGERRLGYINMDGIGAAMGLQVGFPAAVASLLTLIARAPGIAKEYAGALGAADGFSLKTRQGLF